MIIKNLILLIALISVLCITSGCSVSYGDDITTINSAVEIDTLSVRLIYHLPDSTSDMHNCYAYLYQIFYPWSTEPDFIIWRDPGSVVNSIDTTLVLYDVDIEIKYNHISEINGTILDGININPEEGVDINFGYGYEEHNEGN